jgi:hypothetical protein
MKKCNFLKYNILIKATENDKEFSNVIDIPYQCEDTYFSSENKNDGAGTENLINEY